MPTQPTSPQPAVAACLAEALACARRGWLVFPVHGINDAGECTCGTPSCPTAGKHPRTPHGFRDGTTDEQQLFRWWKEWPDANLGILTGGESGLVVLDTDPRHGGDDTLAGLERENGALPHTVSVLTGGGGCHLFFQHPGGHAPSINGIVPGIDLKADGGYVVAPSSRPISGRLYEWEIGHSPDDLDLVPVPDWLTRRVSERPERQAGASKKRRGEFDVEEPRNGAEEGRRDDYLFRLACSLRAKGMPHEGAERQVIEAASKCRPPFPEAEARK